MLVLLRENPDSLSAASRFINRCDDLHVSPPELAQAVYAASAEFIGSADEAISIARCKSDGS